MPDQPRAINPHVTGIDVPVVIECAAQLVDGGFEVSDDYRRGVVELATRLCLCEDDFDAMVEVMGFAVCGVNRPNDGGRLAENLADGGEFNA